MRQVKLWLFIVISALILSHCNGFHKTPVFNRILLCDNFSDLDTGLFSAPVGPLTEYHYLPEAGKKGNWEVACFAPAGGMTKTGWAIAWQVKADDSQKVMCQTFLNQDYRRTHPMIVAGDSLWRDYKLTVVFRPENDSLSSGVAFRYRNSRQFYFFGVKNSMAYISKFNHGAGFRIMKEEILAEQPYAFVSCKDLKAVVTVCDNTIEAQLNDDVKLTVVDDTYPVGKIGLISDARAQYKYVEVQTSDKEIKKINRKRTKYEQELARLRAANPKMVLWKKIATEGFGTGRNLRFGDLNHDGQMDVLIGQVVHHNWPRDSHSELSCLTAMTFDSDILWQIGEPDPEKYPLTNDVAFQIHDFNNDGRNEVIYTMNFELIVADAETGKTLFKTPTPKSKIPDDKFEKILGDCLFFFDCEGKGYDGNLLIKDRYTHFWVMNNKLETLWEGSCKTGHYPYAYDIDGDGKDELLIGYSLYDNDGTLLWCLDEQIPDHCDGVAIVDFDENPRTDPVIMYAASDAGYYRVDLNGNILVYHDIGHVQNPSVANYRTDKPGLETVTINFWGNQGLIHFYDQDGKIYHDFEPNHFGSMCLPLNWTGCGEEYFVHNPNVRDGGAFDGWGRKVLLFPDDGHPDMCNAVLDICGDCRDEIVVWNSNEIWIYTQEDNPKEGKLYKPIRNPLYNYSNYQATVSLPGWNSEK
jgi:rhamnogalacturonan endolyase